MFSKLAAACGLALLAAGHAGAVDERFPGTWNCIFNNMSQTGNPAETWSYQFTFTVNADGRAFAQGQYTSNVHGYYVPFTASGQWSVMRDVFVFDGNSSRQDGIAGPFNLMMTYYGPGNMSYRDVSPSGAMAAGCQK